MAGISNIIPPEYRLYAGTMLPGNKTGTIDESYFNQDFKDQVKDQVLNKMDWGMEFEGYKHPKAFPSGTVRKGQIFPKDYRTEKNPQGYVAPQYGIGRTNPTGYSSVFNTLGTYGYKYNMPTAPAFDNASIDIIDRYDWNPNYGTVGDFTGYIGSGFGRADDEDYVKGTDVDAKMLKQYVMNQIKNKKLNMNQGLELLGNYLGPKQSKGEGKDIKINIPVDTSKTGRIFHQDTRSEDKGGRDIGTRVSESYEKQQSDKYGMLAKGGLVNHFKYGGYLG